MYAWINVRGIRQTAAVSTAFTVSKLIPLTVFGAVGLFFVEPHALSLGSVPRITNVITAILLATFAFFGFDATTVIAGEVRNAPRSVPFAILVSVGSLVLLHALIQMVCVGTLPHLSVSQRPLADAATVFFGSRGSIAINVAAEDGRYLKIVVSALVFELVVRSVETCRFRRTDRITAEKCTDLDGSV